MALITFDDAFKIVQDLAYANKDNFNKFDPFFNHSYMTAEIARDVAEKLGLDAEEASIAGMFHDIGKCLTADKAARTFHEIVGARYIAEKGLELGITDSQEQCYRIAQAARSHFIVYEQFAIAREGEPSHQQWLPGLEDTNITMLMPMTWNELVVTYADLRNVGLNIIPFEERLAKIEAKDKKNGNPRLKAIERAKPRLLEIQKNIETALEERAADLSKYPLL